MLTRLILQVLNKEGDLDPYSIYMETDDNKTLERLAFLSESGYLELNYEGRFKMTERGKELLEIINNW